MKIILCASFVFIFTFLLWGVQSASAANECLPYKDQKVPRPESNHFYTGDGCSGLANAETNKNLKCIGTTGYRYYVYYCDNQKGPDCLARYDEQGTKETAPAICNRDDAGAPTEISKILGIIDAPQAIHDLGFGAKGISKFLSNGITLIYSIAAIVLIFMLLWGAFEWMTSGGDKEKLSSAQKRIINAIIGILLFAAAFAVIRILGQFTGFEFFRRS